MALVCIVPIYKFTIFNKNVFHENHDREIYMVARLIMEILNDIEMKYTCRLFVRLRLDRLAYENMLIEIP